MIQEAYVSFEVAKLLKEKGFNGKCKSYFTNNLGKYSYCEFEITTILCNSEQILRPTHQMALAWLRENYEFHIEICIASDYSNDADGDIVDEWHYWSYIITNLSGGLIYDCSAHFNCSEYQTYAEASVTVEAYNRTSRDTI